VFSDFLILLLSVSRSSSDPGMCGKENTFKGYIELELQLGEIERCRAIYSKYIERMPHNCAAWKNFAQLEANVGEVPRARYRLAVVGL
jgi:crooked neck